ncbi:MAG: protein kinase [Deltaproteobacteria bacterium]|nr:protein kinase [Deltaproteobacteria bacterium]
MGEDHFINLQPGTIVNGRYEVVKCLGTGSMGMVYACRHRELSNHLVAMKVLFAEVARDEIATARFRNEIVASYGVSHPNVVRAYEYFRDGDLVAFTMEYIGGGDLADRLNPGNPLPFDQILHFLKQMCSGVQAIHDAGIIHRDIKPENILITSQGDIKITDFGIARTGTGPKLTEHGGVVGTIDYVSPEYLERGEVDTRSDIYALGVLGYEMITSETPFQGKSVIETMTMRLRTDPSAPITKRPECPEELNRIVMRALQRNPGLRYQSASEMLDDLNEIDLSQNEEHRYYQVDATKTKVNRERPTKKVNNSGHPSAGDLPTEEVIALEDNDEFSQVLDQDLDDDSWLYEPDRRYEYEEGENQENAKENPETGDETSVEEEVSYTHPRIDVEKLRNISQIMETKEKQTSWLFYLFCVIIFFVGAFVGTIVIRAYFGDAQVNKAAEAASMQK